MKYIFPFKEVNKDEKIVLYGAGNIGYQFYRQIMSTGYCDIVCWVDKQYEWYQEMGLPVNSAESIKEYDFDRVVIAAEREGAICGITQKLIELGVDETKIVSKNDFSIKYDIAKKYDAIRVENEASSAYKTNPMQFLSEERMDLIVRYLYAREIIAGELNGSGKKCYEKYFLEENGACEPMDEIQLNFFTEYSAKCGIYNFCDSFCKLVLSMKEQGFDRNKFVPLDKSGYPANGSHRIAAAIAIGEDIWAYRYEKYEAPRFIRSISWFKAKGFSEEECNLIEDTYRGLIKE